MERICTHDCDTETTPRLHPRGCTQLLTCLNDNWQRVASDVFLICGGLCACGYCVYVLTYPHTCCLCTNVFHVDTDKERWGAGAETQKYVRGDIGGWGRVPCNETYAPSVKYHLRRGVGFIKFLENGTRPQPPTSPDKFR